ncbi:MAG: germination protein YpeB, partial [Clostridia bacterium]|nr:germination protein YpeB [Clostridia bacterium]
MININKRTLVRIIAFISVAMIVAVGFIAKEKKTNKRYKLQIENAYSRSLDELNTSVNNISLILQKARYSNSAYSISDMSSQLIGETQLAKTALSQLPSGDTELSNLGRFLSQVGNYAVSVSKTLITDGEMTAEQRENLGVLSDSAKKVAEVIENSSITYNNLDYWAKEIDRGIDEAVPQESLATSLNELEEDIGNTPTLVYDGPYSDHILTAEPSMIKSASEVTKDYALSIASKTTGLNKSELVFSGEENGNIPAFHYGNSDYNVTVSRYGGYPVYMRKNVTVKESILEYPQVMQKAKKYLSSIFGDSFVETYYYTDEGVCVVSFAYIDGETVCYTDLIKVGVSMDKGEIVLLETRGYLSNHKERAFATPEYTVEQAQMVLSNTLKVK